MIRRVSQDGARLLLSDGTILDSSGRSVAHIDPRAGFGWRWAEDDAHFCELTVPSHESFTGGVLEGPVSLLWGGFDAPPRTVAVVGSANGQDSVEVAACNSTADQAVVVQSTLVSVPNRNTMSAISAARELMVVQLSTGRFLYRHTYPIGQDPLSGTMVTVSADGTHVAESLHYAALELKLSRDPASPTTIRELPSGQELGMIDAGVVVTFSGDDSLVLTSTRFPYDAERQKTPFLERLIDWKTGDIAWERSGVFQFVLANPRGRAFLVVEDQSLRLILGDGSSQEVATGVDELWSNFGA
jgi:hypothetical protein